MGSAEVKIGDIIIKPKHDRDTRHEPDQLVITQITPSICASALLPERSSQDIRRVGFPGSIAGPIEVVGELALSNIIDGYNAHLGNRFTDDHKAKMLQDLEEQCQRGSMRYIWQDEG